MNEEFPAAGGECPNGSQVIEKVLEELLKDKTLNSETLEAIRELHRSDKLSVSNLVKKLGKLRETTGS